MNASLPTLARRRRRPLIFRSLGRRSPIATQWGYDRGTPVDRWYIDRFLARHAGDVRDRVLEVKDSSYTVRFGRGVSEFGVLDIDPSNPAATYVADITTCNGIADASFDCVILTQTLQFVYDVPAALQSVYRILRPGGVLLTTVPVTSRVADLPLTDFWRFTPLALKHLLTHVFGGENVEVQGRGNVAAQVAFLHGLAAEELGQGRLQLDDPDLPLLVCGRARKADA